LTKVIYLFNEQLGGKMASSTKTTSASAATEAAVAELQKDLAAVVKQLDALRKSVAACEACCKAAADAPAAAPVDASQFVSKRDWSVWKARVAKKIGLRL
tara:strand:+ start:64 stop:363 length:300 start_codon:yes stop_codon:yes gene_type:complete